MGEKSLKLKVVQLLTHTKILFINDLSTDTYTSFMVIRNINKNGFFCNLTVKLMILIHGDNSVLVTHVLRKVGPFLKIISNYLLHHSYQYYGL